MLMKYSPLSSTVRDWRAPSCTSRATSASTRRRRSSWGVLLGPPTFRSRWTRFLTTFPSGTRWKKMRGPTPSGSTTALAESHSLSGIPCAFKKSGHEAKPAVGPASCSPAPRPRRWRVYQGSRSRKRSERWWPRGHYNDALVLAVAALDAAIHEGDLGMADLRGEAPGHGRGVELHHHVVALQVRRGSCGRHHREPGGRSPRSSRRRSLAPRGISSGGVARRSRGWWRSDGSRRRS